MAHQYFSGAIWTHHALDRISDRKISQDKAGQTFQYPDQVAHGKQPGTTEFEKKFGEHTITVIAKQNDRKEWIVLSCWVDPPYAGTKDFRKKEIYKQYQKAGFWKKVWLSLKKQLYQ
jgi:hypothetical protein